MNALSLRNRLAEFHLLKHPFYQEWMAGKLTLNQLQDYACQYNLHVEAFPRYVSSIHAQCENSSHRRILLENLNDEEGLNYESSHPKLWENFALGLGVDCSTLNKTHYRQAIKDVKLSFLNLCRSSFEEGIGALYAYEYQVPEIAESKILGLVKNYQISDDDTLKFFSVHQTADVYHRESLESIINQMNPDQFNKSVNAALSAGHVLWNFLTDVHGHKNEQTAASSIH